MSRSRDRRAWNVSSKLPGSLIQLGLTLICQDRGNRCLFEQQRTLRSVASPGRRKAVHYVYRSALLVSFQRHRFGRMLDELPSSSVSCLIYLGRGRNLYSRSGVFLEDPARKVAAFGLLLELSLAGVIDAISAGRCIRSAGKNKRDVCFRERWYGGVAAPHGRDGTVRPFLHPDRRE